MRHLGRTARCAGAMIAVLATLALLGAAAASAATLKVCPRGCTYSQISDAVAAAHNGDTVSAASGVYRGGFTIDKDLSLDGAGAGRTIVSGGGPVITVGILHAVHEPTVAIDGVTITNGATTSSPGLPHEPDAVGGGIFVPPSQDNALGATLRLTRSVITGNRAVPASSIPAGFSCGTSGECLYAHAGGGGLDSWGNVTIDRSVISDNQAGGDPTSDANGGGIYAQLGTLTISDSSVLGNRTVAANGSGRFAEGGGIMFDTFFTFDTFGTPCSAAPVPPCKFVITNTVVSGNTSRLTSTYPIQNDDGDVIDMNANSGGIHVGDGIDTTIVGADISHNAVTASDPVGEPSGIDSAMIVGDSPLQMVGTRVEGNVVTTDSATAGDVGPVGSTLEADGPTTIVGLHLVGNIASSITPDGDASINNGFFTVATDPVTVQDSVLSRNFSIALSKTGSATVLGGAVLNGGLLTMRNVSVDHNVAVAKGVGGVAQGGGIWSSDLLSAPPVELTLTNSKVTDNVLNASRGITAQGGGIYATTLVTLNHSVVAHNFPDNCFGCAAGPTAAKLATNAAHRRSTVRGRLRR